MTLPKSVALFSFYCFLSLCIVDCKKEQKKFDDLTDEERIGITIPPSKDESEPPPPGINIHKWNKNEEIQRDPSVVIFENPELEKTPKGVKFKIVSVKQAIHPVEEIQARDFINFKLGSGIIASSHITNKFLNVEHIPGLGYYPELGIRTYQINPLMMSLHYSYDQHRPVRLTPDMFWLTILQGLTFHIRENSKSLRDKIVSHKGKKKINIYLDDAQFKKNKNPNEWDKIPTLFLTNIEKQIPKKLVKFSEMKFSTTGQMESLSFKVAVMDAVQDYFEFEMDGICGIPYLILEGTPADWKKIYDSLDELNEYDLVWWTKEMKPILKELIVTSEGKPNLEFWDDIYKYRTFYAADYINGWIVNFFPYLAPQKIGKGEKPTFKNDLIGSKPQKKGYSLSYFPSGISYFPFQWVESRSKKVHKMVFYSGFIGVSQNKEGVIQSEIGWALKEKQK